jgi:hypothetical protein
MAVSNTNINYIDKPKCIELVNSIDWNSLYDINDVDDMTSFFTRKILDAIKTATKTFTKTKTSSSPNKIKPWITPTLVQKIKTKNSLYKKLCQSPLNSKLHKNYAYARNRLTKELREAKLSYYRTKFNSFNSSQDMWKFLKTTLGQESKANEENITLKTPSHHGDTKITNCVLVANAFNNYFSTVGENLASKLDLAPGYNSSDIESPYPDLSSIDDEFCFTLLSAEQVFIQLTSLNIKKATGLDLIPAWLLKQCSNTLANPITQIFNASLKAGIVPAAFKQAKVKPLFKKGDRQSVNYYRPISILPVISIILEKLVNEQIICYLENKNCLNPAQFGFRRNKSTKDAILEFTNNSLKAMSKGMSILGIFIDFSKAFDTINHNILLNKLKHIGFSDSTLKWFQNYFTDRSQKVILNNHLSSSCKLSVGVPQGSILGPTMFLIYINDLCQCLKLLKPILYADDTNLFHESKNLTADVSKINEDLTALDQWCKHNRLTINLEKTTYIIIKNQQNSFQMPPNLIKINNVTLKGTDEIKFLGVIIDKHLSFKSHISYIEKNIRPYIGLLYRYSLILPRPILKLIYDAYINSKINYCVEVYGTASKTALKNLHILQKRAVRSISNAPSQAHSDPLFTKLNILHIYNLYKYRTLLISHETFYSHNSSSHINHPHFTRSSQLNLITPHLITHSGQRSPEYQVASLWNNLNDSLRLITSHLEFRMELRRSLLL